MGKKVEQHCFIIIIIIFVLLTLLWSLIFWNWKFPFWNFRLTAAEQTDYSVTAGLDRLQISQQNRTLETSTKKTNKENIPADQVASKPAEKGKTKSCDTTSNEVCSDIRTLRRSARIRNKSASDESQSKNYGAQVLSEGYKITSR